MHSGSHLLTPALYTLSLHDALPISTFDVSNGATINFNSFDTRTFDVASTISGAAAITRQSGTNTVSGNYNVTGATIANGATTTLNSISSIGTLSVSAGTLTLNSGVA